MKRLYKVNEGKMLDGVCAGVAEYFNVDPTIIRIAWILVSFFAGFGVLAYIACALVMPRKP